jgi:mono/diheme cytochrome c family protein
MKLRITRKGLLWAGGALAFVATCLTAFTHLRAHRRFDAPYPDIHASRDPAVIERGRYLATGAAHCGECHGAAPGTGVERRERAFTGGAEFHLPVGVFRVPNITPDPETGIGRYTDPEIARLLRYGVRPNGEQVLPFMPFADLSDDDLTAVISYLRTLKPVRHEVKPHEVNALGNVVLAYVLRPKGPSAPPQKSVARAATPEYGRYLTHAVGNCIMCHTKVDLRTGEFAGAPFSGGAVHPSERDPALSFVAPNLTPHPRDGWLEGWSEQAFVARFQGGRVHADSPMPWEAFRNMTDDDLRAIYRFLRTLPPAAGGPDPKKREVTIASR